jgi:DNA replication ATP-dependent helicase Dna2
MENRINKAVVPEYGELAYRSILNQWQSEIPESAKIQHLYRLISFVLEELTRDERIHFTTQFARIAYVGSRFDLSGQLLFGLHHLRKYIETGEMQQKENLFPLALYCAGNLIRESFHAAIPIYLVKYIPSKLPVARKKPNVQKFISFLRVVGLKLIDQNSEMEVVLDIDEPRKSILVFNREDRNSLFSLSLKRIANSGLLPLTFHLLNTEIDLEGKLHPEAIIIDPDYLVDVTSIANCFKSFGSDPRMHLLQRFLPIQNNIHLMIGNIANFILDEIINKTEIKFQELKQKLFRLDPLGFALFEDKLIREALARIQLHYVNLKKVILVDFPKVGIQRKDVYLEPSFYSPKYGIQGRLDVFHSANDAQTDIVELKSGRVFRPNAYGLNQNHYIQTILYDLLVKDTVPKETRITSYILYSAEDSRSLRFAPAIKAKQFEALAVRNAMVETEMYLGQNKGRLTGQILNSYQVKNFPKASGFLKRDIRRFEKAYQLLDIHEKSYFNEFVGFILRELRMAKTGSDELDKLNGMAGLWLNTEEEKQMQFVLLNHLLITKNKSDEVDPIITLTKTKATADLAKFRIGDIVVFFPDKNKNEEQIRSQVFKCTIVDLSEENISIRLRSQQKNQRFFEQYEFWNIEYDFMESGYTGMLRGLFEFAESRKDYRDLVMTNRAPRKRETLIEIESPDELNHEQTKIFKEIISAEEYYLLWGPPGTGKTSRMIKNVVKYLLENTEERILVLAYTNRAVDELCEAILNIHAKIKTDILRIGSSYAVAPEFRELLLQMKMEEITTRKGLVKMLGKKRIVCGTLSSILGKQDLFAIMKFDRVIIDEASQILEPLLIGFLSRFPKQILVGDHLQLPAVVAQDPGFSKTKAQGLKELGLTDMRNSLFERLYLRCDEENWNWAVGQLGQQGRMHEELMKFPNKMFYNGSLSVIENIDRLTKKLLFQKQADELLPLRQHRLIYIPTIIEDAETYFKTNNAEAKAANKLVRNYKILLKEHSLNWGLEGIGIITPFRAQIAKIRACLEEEFGKEANQITIDTVERYQGGAREVIIISFCTNHKRQLEMIQSLSDEGVDRKLNVALTRAKEQIILLGNEAVLNEHPQLKQLVADSFHWNDFATSNL